MAFYLLIFFPLLVFGLIDMVAISAFMQQSYSLTMGEWKFAEISLNATDLLIIFVTTIVVLAILTGLTVFGSGLNAVSVETLLKTGAFAVIFMLLGAVPIAIFLTYGSLGQFFVTMLTIMYFGGVVLAVRGGG